MASLNNAFYINGVVDTSKTVISNINDLATACGCWATYDTASGLWSVIINAPDTSVFSFNDNNIIGAINVSGSGVTEAYNKVTVEFPHKDLRDTTDYVDLIIPVENRYANEIENTLQISTNLLNDPVQAAYIAQIELKQSRLDRIIEFRSDYTALGLKAGDLVTVTNTVYGFSNKLFRIIKVSEADNDDGGIEVSIQGLEYSADIYDATGLIRNERSKKTGILPKAINPAIQQSEDLGLGNQLERLLIGAATTGLLNYILTKNPITGKITQTISPTSASRDAALSKVKKPGVAIDAPSEVCEGATVNISLDLDCNACLFDPISYDYTITGIQTDDISIPLTGNVNVPGTLSFTVTSDSSIENETLNLDVGGSTASIALKDRWPFTYTTTASPTSVTEGGTSTVTINTTNTTNGTTIPYVITGSTTRINTGMTPLNGSVTIQNNTASLTVYTLDDGAYQGTGSVTVTFNATLPDPCGQLDKTAAITILDNDSPPATPTYCSYVEVPVAWCAQYNGSDNQLEALTPIAYAMLPKPLAGESTVNVPKTVTVTKGNPSTITVASTEAVSNSSSVGGMAFNVITSFNSVGPKGLVTGTTTTLYGYY